MQVFGLEEAGVSREDSRRYKQTPHRKASACVQVLLGNNVSHAPAQGMINHATTIIMSTCLVILWLTIMLFIAI